MYTSYRPEALAAGAEGYLIKGCDTNTLQESILNTSISESQTDTFSKNVDGILHSYGVKQNIPIYEFKCDICGLVFEKHFHIKDNISGVVCPACFSNQVHRVYSMSFIEFKGSGFYVNDKRDKTENSPKNKKTSKQMGKVVLIARIILLSNSISMNYKNPFFVGGVFDE